LSGRGDIPPLRPGMRVDGFEVVGAAGRGGQGRLYLVRPWRDGDPLRGWSRRRLSRLAARRAVGRDLIAAERLGVIKLARPEFQANLLNEREYLASPEAAHPHLAALYGRRFPAPAGRIRPSLGSVALVDEAGARQSYTYLALAYEPGGSLAELIARAGGRPLPVAQAVTIAAQVADALEHLHRTLGLVHHDLCPENVMLRGERPPHAVLVDLAAAESLASPRHASVYGRERYLAPEHLAEPPSAPGVGVDIYGLGVLLHDMLGDPAARGRRLGPEDRLCAANPAAPAGLDRLASLALDPDSRRRAEGIPSAAAFAAALRALPLHDCGPPRRLPPSPRQIGAALTAVTVVAWLAFAAISPGRAETPAPAPIVTVTPMRETSPTPAPTSTRVKDEG
jgi:serine/threonine protein kinase